MGNEKKKKIEVFGYYDKYDFENLVPQKYKSVRKKVMEILKKDEKYAFDFGHAIEILKIMEQTEYKKLKPLFEMLKQIYKIQVEKTNGCLKIFNDGGKKGRIYEIYDGYLQDWADSWRQVGKSAPGNENKTQEEIEKEAKNIESKKGKYETKECMDFVEKIKNDIESNKLEAENKIKVLDKIEKNEIDKKMINKGIASYKQKLEKIEFSRNKNNRK